jgi:chromosome segregation ATPase
MSDLDTKRIMISDLETRLATQTARGNDFERALTERRAELAEERQRLADLGKSLLAEQERGVVLEQRIRELEGERDDRASEAAALALRLEEVGKREASLGLSLQEEQAAREAAQRERERALQRIEALEADGAKGQDAQSAEMRSLREQVETLRAERSSLEGALSTARKERARLQKDMKALRRGGGRTSEELKAENADLRQRIAQVADEMLRGASAGDESPKDRRKAS